LLDLQIYFPKDSIFEGLTKTYLSKISKKQMTLAADWKHIHLNGAKLTLFKGQPIGSKDLVHFREADKAYWLQVEIEEVEGEPKKRGRKAKEISEELNNE
jgi:hypothetical protein